MMMKSTVVAAIVFSLAIGTGAALAQNPPPAADQAAAPAASMDKKAISKACSDQANAKGLKGKERKKFRAKCKRHGGKEE
jgi:psiF repeat